MQRIPLKRKTPLRNRQGLRSRATRKYSSPCTRADRLWTKAVKVRDGRRCVRWANAVFALFAIVPRRDIDIRTVIAQLEAINGN